MSSDREAHRAAVRRELEETRRSATATLMVGLGVTLTWLFAYNIISYKMSPLLAFFKILDGINELIIGMLLVVVIGLGIVVVFTLTNLFTQTITNLYSMRILEDLIRQHLFTRQWSTFLYKLVHFNQQPTPSTPFPRYVSSALVVFAYHYLISWFYLVVFSECLYFAAWSAGVYLDLYPETMNVIPVFAIAVPFTARLMAYFKYPYVDEYASFIPGILFVVVLLLAFVFYMGGNFQFLMQDIWNREQLPYFSQGALFWKLMKDGLIIAFYPVLGEVIFFYLMFQDLQKRLLLHDEEDAESQEDDMAEGVKVAEGQDS